MALQGLARSMAFPLMLYKVKTTEGLRPTQAMALVDEVRSEYENIGVSPVSVGNEVYTINSKMWIADGLLSVETIDSKIDFDFVGDIELYQDRVAIASGVPKAYLDQEYGGFGNSAISLMEQYKPFARHVYSIQSAFLQGLGELIRLHFAITGEFDYNTPFVLSMRFPAEEMSSDKEERRTASIELSNSIVELIHNVLGIDEEEPLPRSLTQPTLSVGSVFLRLQLSTLRMTQKVVVAVTMAEIWTSIWAMMAQAIWIWAILEKAAMTLAVKLRRVTRQPV